MRPIAWWALTSGRRGGDLLDVNRILAPNDKHALFRRPTVIFADAAPGQISETLCLDISTQQAMSLAILAI
jgi:hypothetical protein